MNGKSAPQSTPTKRVVRHPRLEGVEFPETNDSELYIPCRPSFFGYCLLRQREDVLKDVSNAQVNETLSKINKFIDVLLISQKTKETTASQTPSNWVFRITAFIAVFLCFLSLVLTVNDTPNFRTTYVFIPLALVLVAVIVCLALVIHSVVQVKKEEPLDLLVSRAIDRILKRENQLHYNSKGYLFEKNENLYWLSLRKVF